MSRRNDTAEANDLGDALLKLEASQAGHPTHDETVALRGAVIEASAALQRKHDAASGEPETTWERIRWNDLDPLPQPGLEIIRSTTENGAKLIWKAVVVRAQPDFEPGWVRVELRAERRITTPPDRRAGDRVGQGEVETPGRGY
jgi:hypothetical protein